MSPNRATCVAACLLAVASVVPIVEGRSFSVRRSAGGDAAGAKAALEGEQHEKGAATINPIRKVVTLLQNMAKKVDKEGRREKELYEKFACYCKTGAMDLETSISDSTAKVPSLQSDIEEAKNQILKLKEDLKRHAADRVAAKSAMAEATGIREKEGEAYVKESTELKNYVDGLTKAITAIEAGMSGPVLMQAAHGARAALLRKAANADSQLTDLDRQSVLAFLAGTSVSGYVPASGEITGILKTMKEGFAKDLAAADKQEKEAVTLYDKLIAAKTNEVQTLSTSIEKKTARVGELQVDIAHMENDLEDTEAALIQDKQFLVDMEKDCSTKTAEMEIRVKMRAQEMTAIQDTIKLLNDDDALELFKKTLPSASFVQLKDNARSTLKKVLAALGHRPKLSESGVDTRFLELVLMGKKVDFSKVIKMIDEMIFLLAQEQAEDEAKRDYCSGEIDKTEDKVKALSKSASDLETSIEDRKEAIKTMTAEIAALKKTVVQLDKQVLEATEQRKEENQEYQELIASNKAAKELLDFAKNRLNKFYNPKLYRAPPKEEEGAASFIQVLAHDKPEPPPVTPKGDYQKKSEESSGVIQMIDLLIRDLEKEMAEAKAEEDASQKEYEQLMNDSAAKRAKDGKSIRAKETELADTEEMKTTEEGELKETRSEFMATEKFLQQLHADCDWLLQNFDLRRTARAEESDNLKAAKAVLSGADFSLLQTLTGGNRPSFLRRD